MPVRELTDEELAQAEPMQVLRGSTHASPDRLAQRGIEMAIHVTAESVRPGLWPRFDTDGLPSMTGAEYARTMEFAFDQAHTVKAAIDPGRAHSVISDTMAKLLRLRFAVPSSDVDVKASRRALATLLIETVLAQRSQRMILAQPTFFVEADADDMPSAHSIVLGRDFLRDFRLEYDGARGTWALSASAKLLKDEVGTSQSFHMADDTSEERTAVDLRSTPLK